MTKKPLASDKDRSYRKQERVALVMAIFGSAFGMLLAGNIFSLLAAGVSGAGRFGWTHSQCWSIGLFFAGVMLVTFTKLDK